MACPDWQAAAAFLESGVLGPDVEAIETHTARVYLAPERAWKLRRPVDYGWLDYGTRARRRRFAEQEIALNAETAPGLYLGLGGVGEGPRLIGPDETVPDEAEPLVVMRRFPAEALFDAMARSGALTEALMHETGKAVAAMHRRRAPVEGPPRLPAMAGAEEKGLSALADLLGRARVDRLTGLLRETAERLMPVAAGRRRQRCHGDLHLGNIVLWQGHPAPFDCIEFNEDFALIDPLFDLAFLTMDLRHRGLARLVPAVLSAWAEAMAAEPDPRVETAYGGLALLPFYEALRAAIRAKTTGIAAQGAEGEARAEKREAARAYADLAGERLSGQAPARLVAVGGRSGTGKTTLARGLASRLDALLIRSDALRKGLAGVPETERLPPEAYTPEASAAVYAAMADRAGRALSAGMAVVLDAAHLDPAERDRARALAEDEGLRFDGVWLEADPGLLSERVSAREGDASDATAAVVARQAARDTGRIDWTHLRADRKPGAVLADAEAALARES